MGESLDYRARGRAVVWASPKITARGVVRGTVVRASLKITARGVVRRTVANTNPKITARAWWREERPCGRTLRYPCAGWCAEMSRERVLRLPRVG